MEFPEHGLYERQIEGEASLAGENGKGKEKDAVPLTAFTENFSSIPFIVPSTFGREIDGIVISFDFVRPPSVLRK